jgi:hypothetical protein
LLYISGIYSAPAMKKKEAELDLPPPSKMFDLTELLNQNVKL